MESTVDQTVMVSKIIGPPEVADSIQKRLLNAAPSDLGRRTTLCDVTDVYKQDQQHRLQSDEAGAIALVAYNEETESDLELITVARRQRIDYVLRGEILADRMARPLADAGNRLAVSWRLTPTDPNEQASQVGKRLGTPVVVTYEAAIKKYPDLAYVAEKQDVLEVAVIRETLPMICPSVQRDDVTLETPFLLPGSRLVRRGNRLATMGRWAEAESEWTEALRWNPWSSVAMHNLSIAKVAKQDFSSARKLARRSILFRPSKQHQRNAVWVEQAQRDFHEAFELPEPPEGWSVTR